MFGVKICPPYSGKNQNARTNCRVPVLSLQTSTRSPTHLTTYPYCSLRLFAHITDEPSDNSERTAFSKRELAALMSLYACSISKCTFFPFVNLSIAVAANAVTEFCRALRGRSIPEEIVTHHIYDNTHSRPNCRDWCGICIFCLPLGER